MSWLFDRLTDLAVAERLEIVVDVEPLDDLDQLLNRAAQLQSTLVRRGCPNPLDAWIREPREVRFIASGTGSARSGVLFADLEDHDLGVAIAAHAPGANIKVDSLSDLNPLLDALITMRSYVQRNPN